MQNMAIAYAAHRSLGAEYAFVSSLGYATRAGRSRTASCVPGGAYRDRTDDPLLAKQVLSQLS